MKRTLPPNIFNYRDARRFVEELCEWKKSHERGFSYRKLAQKAGLRSPNYVQKFIGGDRNLSAATAEQLAAALGLDENAREYFQVLVRLTQASDPEEKRKAYAALLEVAVRNGTGRLDAARFAYFSDWYIPVIHAMASLRGFRADAAWICERISPQISHEEARQALSVLVELGILEMRSPDDYTVREPRLETDDRVRSIWVREYHRSMIGLSLRAIDLWPVEQRVTSALTITVPREHMGELMEWVDGFRKQLFDRVMALQTQMEGVDGEVMQVNLQVFPLTSGQGS